MDNELDTELDEQFEYIDRLFDTIDEINAVALQCTTGTLDKKLKKYLSLKLQDVYVINEFAEAVKEIDECLVIEDENYGLDKKETKKLKLAVDKASALLTTIPQIGWPSNLSKWLKEMDKKSLQ